MTVAGSDAGFSLHGACVHSLRFSFAAPLDYPYSPAEMAPDSPALFRRLQAASPPPARQGAPWQTGLTLDGKPFDPTAARDRLADVKHPEDADNLDTPDPDTVILDWMFDIPRERHTVTMPGSDDGKFLLSVPYWNPAEEAGHDVTKTVEYHATHRIEWAEQPQSDWVAVSFDNFWPKERDSADLLIPLGDCDDLCPTGA